MVASKIGVVILNWNGSDDTVKCVSSLNQAPSHPLDILIIDNHSNEDEFEKLKKLKTTTILRNSENLGYARAVNQGITHFLNKKLKPHFVMLLNNDTYFERGFVNHLVDLLLSDEKIASVNPLIYFGDDKKKVWFSGGRIDKKLAIISNDFFNSENIPSAPYETQWATGCCNLIKIEAIEKVGLFNQNMGMYVEDVEYSLRLRSLGYLTMVHPKSIVYHNVSSASGGRHSMLKRYYISRNTLFVAREFPSYFAPSFWIKNAVNQIYQCIHYPGVKKLTALFWTGKGLIEGYFLSTRE